MWAVSGGWRANGGGSATDYGNGRREDKRCVGPQRIPADRREEVVVHLLPETEVPEEVWRGVTENSDGQDGMAGGGAGYLGGSAGRESFITIRTNAIDALYTPAFGNWQHFVYANDSYSNTYTATSVGGHTKDDDNTYHVIRAGLSRPHWAADGWNTSGYQGIDTTEEIQN